MITGIIGVLFLVATFVIGHTTHNMMACYGSYLVSFLFFLTIALGGMFFVLIHFATRAGWGIVVRRLAEYAMGTMPIFVILAIPIFLGGGLYALYHHWLPNPHHGHGHVLDAIVKGKSGFLNLGFFWVRAALYFAVWILISRWYLKKSLEQDKVGGIAITRKLQYWSPVSIIAFAFSTTFATFDWIMSIDPHWYSTIIGVYFFAGCVIAIYSTLSLFAIILKKQGLAKNIITSEHAHDMGKMVFGFVVFWAYIAFSQFMLIWYANIPEETQWYYYRSHGEWYGLSLALAVGHFVIPFFFIMSRHIKRNTIAMVFATLWVLFFHLVDLYWLIMPTLYHGAHKHFRLVDLIYLVTSFIGIGCLFIAMITWRMQHTNLIPIKDPRLLESISFENV